MDTGQLLAFDRIVREGSFSRAAQLLDISQPTISARIRTLEAEVGGALFSRGGRRLTLTELGENFLPYARRALSILAEGTEAARLAQAGQRGRVTLGVIESLAGGFLATAVTRFRHSHPHVGLFIREGHSDQITQMLDDGVVKLGLVAWPVFGADLVPLLRFREPLVLVVDPAHPLADRDNVDLEEVSRAAVPLLHVRWGPTTRSLRTRMEGSNETTLEVPIDTAHQMVLRGSGAAFLTHTLVSEDLAAGRLVELVLAGQSRLYRESALVRNRRASLPVTATEFVSALQESGTRLDIIDSRFSSL
jgi:DNA-binding transcriptional LysR family regulator